MREFINIIEGAGLNYYANITETVIRGRNTSIFINPSFRRLKTLVSQTRHQEMRAIVDKQNTYFWDAAYGTHREIAAEIGVNFQDIGACGFFFVTSSNDPHGDAAPPIAEWDGLSLCITPHLAKVFEDTPSMTALLDAFGLLDDDD